MRTRIAGAVTGVRTGAVVVPPRRGTPGSGRDRRQSCSVAGAGFVPGAPVPTVPVTERQGACDRREASRRWSGGDFAPVVRGDARGSAPSPGRVAASAGNRRTLTGPLARVAETLRRRHD